MVGLFKKIWYAFYEKPTDILGEWLMGPKHVLWLYLLRSTKGWEVRDFCDKKNYTIHLQNEYEITCAVAPCRYYFRSSVSSNIYAVNTKLSLTCFNIIRKIILVKYIKRILKGSALEDKYKNTLKYINKITNKYSIEDFVALMTSYPLPSLSIAGRAAIIGEDYRLVRSYIGVMLSCITDIKEKAELIESFMKDSEDLILLVNSNYNSVKEVVKWRFQIGK